MIIGISGKIGAGKDTTTNIIRALTSAKDSNMSYEEWIAIYNNSGMAFVDLNGRAFEIKRFAQKLKQICALLIGCKEENFEDQSFKNSCLPPEWQTSYYINVDESTLATHAELSNMTLEEFMASDRIDDYNDITKTWRIKTFKLEDMKTYRWLLQQVGTEAMRGHVHDNIWVNGLMADYGSSVYYMCDRCGKHFSECLIVPSRFKHLGYMEDERVCPHCKGEESEGDITKVISDNPNWIVTDVRFPNEAKAIKERGGIIIRINKDWEKRLRRKLEDEIEEGAYNIGTPGGTMPVCMTGKGGYINFLVELERQMRSKMSPEHISETALDDYDSFDHVIDNSGSPAELVGKLKLLLTDLKLI